MNRIHQDDSQTGTAHIESLINEARQGNKDALGELLETHRRYLVFLARSGLHEDMRAKTDPSDIAQEVCVAAQGNMAEFRGESPEDFAAWIRGILKNTLSMHCRKYLGTLKRDVRLEQRCSQSVSDASDFLQSQMAADITSPSQHLARKETSLQLAEAIERLPEDYREVIMLRHVQSLPFADVASEMGRSVDSVEKLWVRGLAKLQGLMKE
ncbi:MAG: sigma-70 family RNA polymerase sigma factor [Planctomycetota bacterium]